jgi:hypothetical protein
MLWATEILCKPPKSRDACILEVMSGFSNSPFKPAVAEMATWDQAEVLEAASGLHTPHHEILAWWMFAAGGKRSKDFGLSALTDLPVAAFYEEMDIPALVQSIAPLHARATGGVMQISSMKQSRRTGSGVDRALCVPDGLLEWGEGDRLCGPDGDAHRSGADAKYLRVGSAIDAELMVKAPKHWLAKTMGLNAPPAKLAKGPVGIVFKRDNNVVATRQRIF